MYDRSKQWGEGGGGYMKKCFIRRRTRLILFSFAVSDINFDRTQYTRGSSDRSFMGWTH